MKKVLLSLVAILIISVGSAKAQTVWGIRAGMGAPIVTSDSESLSGKFGFEIGPTAYFSLNNKLYLNAAALFSMKTFEYISLSYLEVPIGAKYGLTDVSGYGEKLITPFLGVSYIF